MQNLSPDDLARDRIRQVFFDSYYRIVRDQTETMHLMEEEAYRRLLPNISPELAADVEKHTLEERLEQVPFLATAGAVADTILFALRNEATPQ